MDDQDRIADTGAPNVKRSYRAPVLREYGSLEDLVDTGVIGATTVPSITPKLTVVPLLGR